MANWWWIRGLADAMTGPAQELRKAIQRGRPAPHQFWRNLVGLSVMVDGLRRTGRAGRDADGRRGGRRGRWPRSLVPPLAGLEAAVRRRVPEPGGRTVAAGAAAARALGGPRARAAAEYRAVDRPARRAVRSAGRAGPSGLGGGGAAHIPYNNVHIEAVLTNPVPDLPEILRLGLAARPVGSRSARVQRPGPGSATAGRRRAGHVAGHAAGGGGRGIGDGQPRDASIWPCRPGTS